METIQSGRIYVSCLSKAKIALKCSAKASWVKETFINISVANASWVNQVPLEKHFIRTSRYFHPRM